MVWFEILLSWSLHPWFHPSWVRGTSPCRQAPMSLAKVMFLSEAPWEVAHGTKFHFLNNYLLAIVKKHKVWEKGGILMPNVMFARQGKEQFCTWSCMTPVLPLLCKSGNCNNPQPAQLHSVHPSLTPAHVGTQNTKECTSDGETRAKSVWGEELQGSHVWTSTEQVLECAANKLQCTNAV